MTDFKFFFRNCPWVTLYQIPDILPYMGKMKTLKILQAMFKELGSQLHIMPLFSLYAKDADYELFKFCTNKYNNKSNMIDK